MKLHLVAIAATTALTCGANPEDKKIVQVIDRPS
jgi:hypothetical protein